MGGAGPPGARDTVRRDACAGQYPAGPVRHRPSQADCLTLSCLVEPRTTRADPAIDCGPRLTPGCNMETMVLCPDLLTLRPSSLPGQHLSVWTRSYILMIFYVVLLLKEYQTQSSSEVRGVKWEGWIIGEILTGARSV